MVSKCRPWMLTTKTIKLRATGVVKSRGFDFSRDLRFFE